MDTVETVLTSFGKYVKQQAKTNLTKEKHKDTSALYNGINYTVFKEKNGYELVFGFDTAEDYWQFVDAGVKGNKSSLLAPSSPFQYKDKAPPTKPIIGWVTRKRFQFRKPNGKFMSYASTGFLIAKSIQKRGLKTTRFFTEPFERAFKRVPDEVYAAYSLEVDELLVKFTS